ncbi:MAG: sugar porter family MFS transporter [Saprospiraceae bacterium]|nr:sugar porter family MFS transporter [Saprospiraceae bacterium]
MKQTNNGHSGKLMYWTITVALAGFLFGFDTIVISGADQPIQQLWNTSPLFHGMFIMSMALWGTVIGALFGGIPCNILGRKKTLFWIGILYAVSALGSGLSTDPYMFSFFRFIGGLGVGASSVAAPIYISEIAPAEKRGRLVAAYQFNIVFGILIAFLSNYLFGKFLDENSWRWMLGIEALPALIYTALVTGVPNSPRWLAMKGGNDDLVKSLLHQLGTTKDKLKSELELIKSSLTKEANDSFFSFKYRIPIGLAFMLAFFNQMSGINFVLYYAPRIFESAGIATENILGASIPIGVVNLVFTMLGMYFIDRLGRKTLMIIGSLGYIITLLGVAWAFYSDAEGLMVVIFVSAFVGAHAIGQGAVIWVFISEIFPNRMRDSGMSFGSGTHWVFAAIITLITPWVISHFSSVSIFLFFAFMMLLQLLWVLLVMPETKGVELEELEKRLIKS